MFTLSVSGQMRPITYALLSKISFSIYMHFTHRCNVCQGIRGEFLGLHHKTERGQDTFTYLCVPWTPNPAIEREFKGIG